MTIMEQHAQEIAEKETAGKAAEMTEKAEQAVTAEKAEGVRTEKHVLDLTCGEINQMDLPELRNYIKGTLFPSDALAQLAEECAELAQAALKALRIENGRNSVAEGVTYESVQRTIRDEACDVMNVLYLLGIMAECNPEKMRRWLIRQVSMLMKKKMGQLPKGADSENGREGE